MTNKRAVKREIGDFVVNETLRFVEQGNSPVSGVRKFKRLSEKYADQKKGGDRNPNLELMGDMLDALTYKQRADGLEIGVFGKEASKAKGHNTGFAEHPVLDGKVPKRQFIPSEGEGYKQRIERGIKQIIKENSRDTEVAAPRITPSDLRGEQPLPTSISLQDIFSQDFLERFLDGES